MRKIRGPCYSAQQHASDIRTGVGVAAGRLAGEARFVATKGAPPSGKTGPRRYVGDSRQPRQDLPGLRRVREGQRACLSLLRLPLRAPTKKRLRFRDRRRWALRLSGG